MYGHYRTKDTILDIYDKMAAAQEAIAAATTDAERRAAAYQTVLDPPPGPPTDEAGNFIPYADWTPEIHARYAGIIHPQREQEAPRRVAVAPPAFPTTERERAICSVALAIVGTSGGISSDDHLTSLLLATHMDWCRPFLEEDEAAAASTAATAAPAELAAQGDASIRWLATREYLVRSGAITIEDRGGTARLQRGPRYDEVRGSLPAGVDEIAGLCLLASARLGDLSEAAMNERQAAAFGHLITLRDRERDVA